MSLKQALFGFARNMDKQRKKSYQKEKMIEEFKYQAISYSDKYFDLMDQGNDFEFKMIYSTFNDLEEEVDAYKLVAENWDDINEKMKRLSTPTELPSDVYKLFVESHEMLIEETNIKSQINLLHMNKLIAEENDDYELRKEYESKIKILEELIPEMEQAYRNAFDALLDIVNNL
ncbi:hypothetical protein [Psychrobacillus sp. FSL K6-1415]|uniref:hypothetical protein n=1 Tax=Psychrobacillus sp. FSL K6-1415 TaxID=2921544 RepID=UPI0030F6D9D9